MSIEDARRAVELYHGKSIRRSGRGWACRCVVHADTHESAWLFPKADGSAGVSCRKGCDWREFMDILRRTLRCEDVRHE
jgi:hypothetical protein